MSRTESSGPNVATKSSDEPNGHVELQDISGRPKLPVEEDIMQLARLGEIRAIQSLYDSKKYSPTYRDEQGITPLHVSFIVSTGSKCSNCNSGLP
jgi:palmitoyltransferase ZDHHC13/17